MNSRRQGYNSHFISIHQTDTQGKTGRETSGSDRVVVVVYKRRQEKGMHNITALQANDYVIAMRITTVYYNG
jgi:hypothetical protein